jgi:membrane-associated phospholipid phosphatase
MSISVISSTFAFGPLFYEFNYRLLALLFRLFPLTDARMNLAQFFIENRLVSGWLFAAACYVFWSIRDERTDWRRAKILEASAACVTAAVLMLAVRPFIGALPPSRAPEYQQLFPPYLWDFGSGNSFPSHSTLVYLSMAAGLWPINRKISAILSAWVFLAVSLPRVYIGGHYPTDVLGSIVIAAIALWAVWRLGATPWGTRLLDWLKGRGLWLELAMFLWLFELGEGFRSTLEIAKFLIRHALRAI